MKFYFKSWQKSGVEYERGNKVKNINLISFFHILIPGWSPSFYVLYFEPRLFKFDILIPGLFCGTYWDEVSLMSYFDAGLIFIFLCFLSLFSKILYIDLHLFMRDILRSGLPSCRELDLEKVNKTRLLTLDCNHTVTK